MAHIIAHVWHDAGGQIIAVGRSRLGENSGRNVVPIASPNQFVLEVKVAEEDLRIYTAHTLWT